jgi:pyruvate-ferredoxin/flavodoxin oxidoreductase
MAKIKTSAGADQSNETAAPEQVTMDANEAAAYVAYRTNEVVAIYPITPSSPMAELADAWAAAGQPNLWGTVPLVQEMQSEGGAAGAAHGALTAGALTTSFTSSQGLLLMVPNMFKIAGELTSAVFHVTARALSAHALSIFCEHSDVMATRTTGWSLLFSNTVQEAHDFALISQASTMKARVPFLHCFDGFRTSHEVSKIQQLRDEDIKAMIDDELVMAHRRRGLSPEHPVVRGTAQNPDVFFQSRERSNPFYDRTPAIVEAAMEQLAARTGRHYKLFDYVGHPEADRVIVAMGSGCETVAQTVEWMVERGEKVGLIKVRLYRPFSAQHLLKVLPASARTIAVLDRTKEPGAAGEPLLEDVLTALFDSRQQLRVIGGRYGLGSKEFTPAMVKAIFAEMSLAEPRKRFTVGIFDDVTNLSLDYDPEFDIESNDIVRAVFWGLGSDGTVGANKNSIKIIGEYTPNYAQGYFVYDSKKSGSVTISHLRFGPRPIESPYLISHANFVAVHQFGLLERFPVLDLAMPGATVLLNSPYPVDQVWDQLPRNVQEQMVAKKLKVYTLDAVEVARETGMGGRINTIMQVGFFSLSGVLPREEAIAHIKDAIEKSYSKFGEPVVRQNFAAVDSALDHLYQVKIPDTLEASKSNTGSKCSATQRQATVCANTSTGSSEKAAVALASGSRSDSKSCSRSSDRCCDGTLTYETTMELIAGRGDQLPVSAMPIDGTYPTGTAKLEKRDIALEVPVWDPSVCIQCGKCVMVCPHAVIRSKVVPADALADAPETFKTVPASWKELKGQLYTLQVSDKDCTGCSLCVETCPAKNKSAAGRKAINMEIKTSLPDLSERQNNWNYFLELKDTSDANVLRLDNVKNVQLKQPFFEFSGACGGCGETPYLKLLSQLFGDRAVIANATGCSSIYGGNLPTTPWTTNAEGRGPAWANSLFEDNAEYGMGMRLAMDLQIVQAKRLVNELKGELGSELCEAILNAHQSDDSGIKAQRERVALLKEKLRGLKDEKAMDLVSLADLLVKRSLWIVGGDGWAYDIGYGGLDHVLASGKNVNILVLDTEVYSNTGGQMSKSTARGAVAKFAAGGKANAKKDLGRLAMTYGNVYVAKVAMGANDAQTVKAFLEAEAFDGPSLIIAYSHCIAHGIDMSKGMHQQKLAVQSGHWPLYRYSPDKAAKGENPISLDSSEPSIPLDEYYYSETRYRMLKQSDPAAAAHLLKEAKQDVAQQWKTYHALATAAPNGSGSKTSDSGKDKE